jgi:hypothetical protein
MPYDVQGSRRMGEKFMAEFQNETFTDQRVELDGNTYTNCTFVNSQMVFRAAAPVTLQGVNFENCTWTFDDAAGLTISFMTALYRGGMAQLMEQTFANMRGEIPAAQAAPPTPARQTARAERQRGTDQPATREERQERRRQRQAAATGSDEDLAQ